MCKGGSREAGGGLSVASRFFFLLTIPPSPNGDTSLYTREACDATANPPTNQNLNGKLMFIGVLYFVVGEDIILPQRTITACFREANSLPYGVCAKLQQTDKSKFEIHRQRLPYNRVFKKFITYKSKRKESDSK